MKFFDRYNSPEGFRLVFGDQKTAERMKGALQDSQRGVTHSERKEGLIPCISLFHLFGNILEVLPFIVHF